MQAGRDSLADRAFSVHTGSCAQILTKAVREGFVTRLGYVNLLAPAGRILQAPATSWTDCA